MDREVIEAGCRLKNEKYIVVTKFPNICGQEEI